MGSSELRSGAVSRRRPAPLLKSRTKAPGVLSLATGPKAVSQREARKGPTTAIGYLLDGFPHSSDCFILDEIVALGRCGVNVHVFVAESGSVTVNDPWLGLPVPAGPNGKAPSPDPVPCVPEDSGANDEAGPRVSLQARWIAREVAAKQIRHLHAQMGTAHLAREVKRLTGVSYSFTASGEEYHRDWTDAGLLQEKIGDAEFVVAPNDLSAQRLRATTRGAEAPRVYRINHGVDLDRCRFHAQPGRDPHSVLAVCPLRESSGVTDLIEAIAILRDRRSIGVRLTIVGQGELEDQLRGQIKALGLSDRVTLLRVCAGFRRLALMRLHAVMALPYVAPPTEGHDGVPPALLEAMAVGLPVVATSVAGMSDVIDDGWTGRVVAPNDPAWLAGAVETLLDNQRLRVRMAQGAREKVERDFALSNNVSHLARLFTTAATTFHIST
jgi:glycosyltransferase involved in cell wall biosynthesis